MQEKKVGENAPLVKKIRNFENESRFFDDIVRAISYFY